MGVRFTEAEHAALEQAAARGDRTVADYVRRAALRAAQNAEITDEHIAALARVAKQLAKTETPT